ncbi:Hypothetical protein PBC10988_24850 [Planctomycetales bacterium 10988]|nr:Hypothetical protein PBC10988_24850 [Planctomycetales bacterium 10988]
MIELPDVTNEREYRVFAMKRSGHHAVMNWLIGHFSGPIYFLNNGSFEQQIEFCSTRVGRMQRTGLFSGRVSIFCNRGENMQLVEHIHKKEYLDDPPRRLRAMLASEKKTLEETPFPTEREAYLFNLEDFHLDDLPLVPWEATARGNSAKSRGLIVLRDPYNWLASRKKGNFPISQEVLSAWKSHAREAVKPEKLDQPLVINYNLWFQSQDYRESIADCLQLTPTDEGIDYIADFGGGSSFTGFEYQHRAREMGVLTRYKEFKHDAEYRRYFEEDPELVALGKEVFAMSPLR